MSGTRFEDLRCIIATVCLRLLALTEMRNLKFIWYLHKNSWSNKEIQEMIWAKENKISAFIASTT
jgi:hypothetical protein